MAYVRVLLGEVGDAAEELGLRGVAFLGRRHADVVAAETDGDAFAALWARALDTPAERASSIVVERT